MRWYLCLLIAAGLALAPPALAQKKDAPHAKDEPQLSAPHAILVDAENGSVLYQRDPDQLIFPASLAKLMTVEYVFHLVKDGKVSLTDEFPVSEYAWRTGGAPSHSSTMYAAINSKVPVADLLRGAIIQSGNDACIILAEGIAGSESNFAVKLTERARQIGLEKSVFANSNGLPNPDTHVTTRELAILARHIILEYPDLYPIFGEAEFTWNKIRQYNRNPLLKMSVGADGLKTGFTKEAGYGLVGSAVQNGLRLIVVVNGEKSAKERGDEAKKLLDWGFRSFEQRVLFEAGTNVGTAKVYGGADSKVSLVADKQVRVMMPKAGGERLIARVVYTGPVPAPVKKGQQVGAIKVWRGDNLILTQPLRAAEDVGKGTLTQRAFDALSEMVIALFRAGAERL
jgi:D-alanyl-D-alanine carboxypeptidase (penicillin-binding protein 5/6)